jgi:hypothetical protein
MVLVVMVLGVGGHARARAGLHGVPLGVMVTQVCAWVSEVNDGMGRLGVTVEMVLDSQGEQVR